jgi:NAD(P)-dependent dehydrogenase (short-subunit alcohol dehydrogenase family)
MIFSESHGSAFLKLSSDTNPLHWDADYSKRTQYGRVVLYGMAAVTYALGSWAKGRHFQLTEIEGDFRKPIFLHEDLQLKISEKENEVEAFYLRGDSIQASIKWHYKDGQTKAISSETFLKFKNSSNYKVQADNVLSETFKLEDFNYAVNESWFDLLKENFGLSAGQLPAYQLATILGSSYIVGMLYPGQQALFSTFKFQFEPTTAIDELKFNLSGKFDARFNLATITGSAPGLKSLKITAFRRPEAVDFPIGEMPQPKIKHFKDKVVLISGASRGFGSVLAKKFALEGAIVFMCYRSQKEQANKVLEEIRPFSPNASILECDLTNASEVQELCKSITKLGLVDILINNASDVIRAEGFSEQSSSDFVNFVSRSLGMYVNVTHELLPLLSPGGIVLNISSIFTESPVRQFSHYISAKSAIEGWTKSLAKEFPKQKFVIAKLPRILTDQSNTVSKLGTKLPTEVADNLLEFLGHLDEKNNYAEFVDKKIDKELT